AQSQVATRGSSVTAHGSSNLTCQWSRNGFFINGATSTSCTLSSAQYPDHGCYLVKVTDSTGATLGAAGFLDILLASEEIIEWGNKGQIILPMGLSDVVAITMGGGCAQSRWEKERGQ
ncbi:MAG: hypothetical protein V4710_07400, partial [Verrucomicrobiota bacterium]